LNEDFGLIRYIQNGDEVTVYNVNLNDPELISNKESVIRPSESQRAIDNVGAVVGRISTKKANVYDNLVGEVKIDIPEGSKIGGVVGYTQLGWKPTAGQNNYYVLDGKGGKWVTTAETVVPDEIDLDETTSPWRLSKASLDMHGNRVHGVANKPCGLINGYDYVGGITGKIEKPTTAEVIENNVELQGNVKIVININAQHAWAGGITGYIITTDKTQMNQNFVYCAKNIEASNGWKAGDIEGQYVGGLAGETVNKTKGELELFENKVRAKNIRARKSWAGGLVGRLTWPNASVTIDDSEDIYNDDATVIPEEYMVIVEESILADNTYAGGLIGQSVMDYFDKSLENAEYVMAAQVKANLIQATNGYAGGLIGQVALGNTEIGDQAYDTSNRHRGVIVEVNKMAGRRAVGGMIGHNAQAGGTKVYIYDGDGASYWVYPGLPEIPYQDTYKTYSFVEVQDWARTGAELNKKDWKESQYYGTISNVIGHMADVFYIENDLSTATATNPSRFLVIDHLDSAKKIEVGYQNHWDNDHTEIDVQKYWGDKNGYVGWRSNNDYFIGGYDNSKNSVHGEEQMGYKLPSCNLFFTVGPDGDYDTSSSKLPTTGTLAEMLQ
jgi:hypothetical protein